LKDSTLKLSDDICFELELLCFLEVIASGGNAVDAGKKLWRECAHRDQLRVMEHLRVLAYKDPLESSAARLFDVQRRMIVADQVHRAINGTYLRQHTPSRSNLNVNSVDNGKSDQTTLEKLLYQLLTSLNTLTLKKAAGGVALVDIAQTPGVM